MVHVWSQLCWMYACVHVSVGSEVLHCWTVCVVSLSTLLYYKQSAGWQYLCTNAICQVSACTLMFYLESCPACVYTGRTLRRGGVALGRAVGNFFGVTDESQHGSATTVGWEAVSVNRAEVYTHTHTHTHNHICTCKHTCAPAHSYLPHA